MRKVTSIYAFLICLIILSFSKGNIVNAQNIITVAVPSSMQPVLEETFADFEAAHPEVQLRTVATSAPSRSLYLIDPEQYYAELATYAASADVLYMREFQLGIEATQSQYVLDLRPLTDSDPEFDADKFYLAALQSFQWQGGLWAIPTDFAVGAISYDPTAFDERGLTYPDANWTLEDFIFAAETLTEYDDEGNVTQFGLEMLNSDSMLLRAANGEAFVMNDVASMTQDMVSSNLGDTLTLWNNFTQNTTIGPVLEGGGGTIDFDRNSAMVVTDTTNEFVRQNPDRQLAPLPGGQSGVFIARGLSISAGTANPQLAFDLIKHLADHPAISQVYGTGAIPATIERSTDVFAQLPAEIATATQNLLSTSFPFSDYIYGLYLRQPLRLLRQGQDTITALNAFRSTIQDIQTRALAERKTNNLVVDAPSTIEISSSDESTIRFGAATSLQDTQVWNTVIDEFVENNPAISRVELIFINSPDFDFANDFDCFYFPGRIDEILADNQVTDLSPLTTVDPNFDEADFVPGILESVTRDNRLTGYPMTVQTLALAYDPQTLQSANITVPPSGWTISEFVTVLDTLQPYTPDTPVFGTNAFIPTHLLMLIAAYGGLPVDYSTVPPTINFTSPENVTAIQQTLALAQDGHLIYRPQLRRGEAGGNFVDSTIMSTVPGRAGNLCETPEEQYTLFPRGTRYTPLASGTGASYIPVNSQQPVACYEFFKVLAQRPDLLSEGIPAQLSVLQSTRYTDLMPLFTETLQDPNLVIFPSSLLGGTTPDAFYLESFLFNAFDRYMLEGVSLESALSDAQAQAMFYLQCEAELPEDRSPEDYEACALSSGLEF